jgi:hypothetical protein
LHSRGLELSDDRDAGDRLLDHVHDDRFGCSIALRRRGLGAFIGAFFVTARFAVVLVTRFFGAILAATRLAILVRAARLGALPRFSVAFRVAPRFFG